MHGAALPDIGNNVHAKVDACFVVPQVAIVHEFTECQVEGGEERAVSLIDVCFHNQDGQD